MRGVWSGCRNRRIQLRQQKFQHLKSVGAQTHEESSNTKMCDSFHFDCLFRTHSCRTVKRISRFSCAFVCVARIDGWHKDKYTHNGTDSKQELHKIPLYFAENPCFFHRFSSKIQKKIYEINLFYCLHEKYRIRFVNICIRKKRIMTTELRNENVLKSV